MKKILHITISFLCFILLWQVLFLWGGYNSALFPSPRDAWHAFEELIQNGILWADIRISLWRFAVGYLGASLLAVLLGLFLGWHQKLWRFFNPIAQVLRPISPVAWLPFIVLFFGIGEVPAIVIIFLAAFFPVLLSTVSAVGAIDQTYLKVAQNFDIREPEILWKIILPAAFPRIATGLHLALGTAWVFLVAGEMAGAQSGLGFLVIDARNNLRADWLVADMVVIGLLGLCLDSLMRGLEYMLAKRQGAK